MRRRWSQRSRVTSWCAWLSFPPHRRIESRTRTLLQDEQLLSGRHGAWLGMHIHTMRCAKIVENFALSTGSTSCDLMFESSKTQASPSAWRSSELVRPKP
jgi:hypothetical protein